MVASNGHFCLFAVGIAWATLPFTDQIIHQQMTEAGVPSDQIEISIKIARIFASDQIEISKVLWKNCPNICSYWFARCTDYLAPRYKRDTDLSSTASRNK